MALALGMMKGQVELLTLEGQVGVECNLDENQRYVRGSVIHTLKRFPVANLVPSA